MTPNTIPAIPPTPTDGEWEQVDADNAIITFDKVGQNEEGFFDGEDTVHNKKKDEDIPVFCFHREDGVRWRTWANKADLQQKLAVIKPGQFVRVTYLGRQGGGSVGKHLFDVKRKKPR
jgi:hypothetical protein